jgi:hypothetical protein
MKDLYRAFDVWKREGTQTIVRYRCFENLGTGGFCVQSADFYRSPVTEERMNELQGQYIELLLQESPFKRAGSFATVEEAIRDHIEIFGKTGKKAI